MDSPSTPPAASVPAFVNSGAGTAPAAEEALAQAGGFDVRPVTGKEMQDAVRQAVEGGARRVVIAGGDGSIGCAAGVLAGTDVELAVLPGGTLNHLARDHGIPTDLADAAATAAQPTTRRADVAEVNGRVFLNTSSVGAYVVFVRTREQLERRMGYRVASFLAAIRTLWSLHRFRVDLEVEGQRRTYYTPIVFIGVGERELQMPLLGNRRPDGRRGLHVFVVRGRTRGALLALGLSAAARGVRRAAATPALDAFIVDSCRIEMRRPGGNVAVDGEIVRLISPLEYTLRRDALTVVVPPPGADG